MSAKAFWTGRWVVMIAMSAGTWVVFAAATARATELAADATAGEVVEASGAEGGLVVHVGSGDPARWAAFTAELGIDPRCLVHGLYGDPEAIDEVRRRLRASGRYGRVSAEPWTGPSLPYAEGLVNLLVATDLGKISKDEVMRVLAPGAVAMIRRQGDWTRIQKPRSEAIDDWTHAMYDASGNAVASDTVVGPPHRLQWVAPPANARHHESLASISAVVSAGGRLFYIIDEAPTASILLRPQWAVVARDAFSSVALWKRTIPAWESHLKSFRSGPPEVARTLVATGERVYVTLGLYAQVTALDAATGQTAAEYPATEGTEEILYDQGTLYVVRRELSAGQRDAATKPPRGIMAVDASSGKVLWDRPRVDPMAMTLAVGGGRVFFLGADALECLDAGSGESLWRTPRAVAQERPGWSAPTLVVHDGVVLLADRQTTTPDLKDELTGKQVVRWLAMEGWPGDLIAYSAQSGEELWKCRCAEAYHAPVDVFVADGLVWVGQSRSRDGPDFVAGRDLHTGRIKRRLDTAKAFETTMPHHRCHRNRATERFLVLGRTGVEFIDVATGDARRHHWVRGTCQFGTLPCNGLLYAPPHSCACYIQGKLTGFLALAPRSAQNEPGTTFGQPPRLSKGPAFGRPLDTAADNAADTDAQLEWPSYRHDGRRGAYTPQTLPSDLGYVWETQLDERVSSPVVAQNKVFVATVDTHTVHALDAATGRPVWTFTAGGRIDSPPTVRTGRVVFGSADGSVYCLRGDDGELIWRRRAASRERRIVALGQVESAWPVHGSVLIDGDSVYCVAGRSSYLDGGLLLLRLSLHTGEVLAERTIYDRDPVTGRQPDEPIMFEMPGAQPDVLSTDGELIYMRHLAFDRQTLDLRPAARHVYSPAGFLDDNWWHRTYWIDGTHFYSGYIGWYFAGRETIAGRLLTFNDATMYGFGYRPEYYRGSRGRKYHLFAVDRAAQPPQPPVDYARANRDYPHSGGGKFSTSFLWSENASLLVRAMVATDDKLFIVGPPVKALENTASLLGASGALMNVVGTKDGQTLKRYTIEALPVFDGLAAAYGRLYLTMRDGRVACLGGMSDAVIRPLATVPPLDERLPPLVVAEEPGLVGYWKFDEGLGNRARDSSGQSNDGEAREQWATGDFGICLRSDGTPAVVEIPDGPNLQFGSSDFTLQLWVSLEQYDCRLLGKENFPRNWWVINVLGDGRAELVLGGGQGRGDTVRASSETPLVKRAWTHLTYVVDRTAGVVRCYVNGKLDGTAKIPEGLTGPLDVKGTGLRIPSPHKPFRGLFDELRIYKRTLGDEEVRTAYEKEKANRTSAEWELAP